MLVCNAVTKINVDKLVQYTKDQSTSRTIDSVSYLSDDKTYLFSGTKDSVVNPKVMGHLQEYYGNFLYLSDCDQI
jgi:hypothetical protein